MTIGYGIGAACFAARADASATACVTQYPVAGPSGMTSCNGADVNGLLHLAVEGEGSFSEYTVSPAFPDCIVGSNYAGAGEMFLLLLGAAAVVHAMKLCVLRLVSNT